MIVSGSEYNSDQDAEGESEGTGSISDEKPPPPQPPVTAAASRRGRGRKRKQASDDDEYEEDAAGEEDEDEEDEELLMEHRKRQQQQQHATTRSGRTRRANLVLDSEDSDEVVSMKPKRRDRDMKGFVVASGDEDSLDEDADYGAKPSRAQREDKLRQLNARAKTKAQQQQTAARGGRPTRNSALARPIEEDLDPDADWGTNGDDTDSKGGAKNLRKRTARVNYAIPTLDQINAAEAANAANGPNKVIKRPKLPLNMTGRQLDRFFGTGGRPGDSSVRLPPPSLEPRLFDLIF